MLKTMVTSAAAPLALFALAAAPAQAAPAIATPALLLANPPAGGSDAGGSEAAIMEMFAQLFDTGEQTPIDPAQLALGQVTAARLLPDGAYGAMMDQMMGQIIKLIMAMDPGMSPYRIASMTGVDVEAAEKLTEAQRNAVVAILDPNRQARSEATLGVFRPMMIDIGKTLEGPLREGLARAYARKFSAAQLNEVNAFFATPGGAAFAAQSFAIQGDPEVLAATFKALPVMLTKFMGSTTDLEAQMKALPQERKLSELNEGELKQLAGLLGTSVDALKSHAEQPVVETMMADSGDGDDAAAAAAEAAALAGAAVDGPQPWFDRANWSAEDRAMVEALEQKVSEIITQQIEAEDAVIERTRKRMQSSDKEG
jgi:hypothetical protein